MLKELIVKYFESLILFNFQEDLIEFLRIRYLYRHITQRLGARNWTEVNWQATPALVLLCSYSWLLVALHLLFFALFFFVPDAILFDLLFAPSVIKASR